MGSQTFIKDPQAELDYSIDWSIWLAPGETISTSTWTVPSGLTQPNPASNTGTIATVWLGGGSAKSDYEVKNTITTSADRVDERTLQIKVRNR